MVDESAKSLKSRGSIARSLFLEDLEGASVGVDVLLLCKKAVK